MYVLFITLFLNAIKSKLETVKCKPERNMDVKYAIQANFCL